MNSDVENEIAGSSEVDGMLKWMKMKVEVVVELGVEDDLKMLKLSFVESLEDLNYSSSYSKSSSEVLSMPESLRR